MYKAHVKEQNKFQYEEMMILALAEIIRKKLISKWCRNDHGTLMNSGGGISDAYCLSDGHHHSREWDVLRKSWFLDFLPAGISVGYCSDVWFHEHIYFSSNKHHRFGTAQLQKVELLQSCNVLVKTSKRQSRNAQKCFCVCVKYILEFSPQFLWEMSTLLRGADKSGTISFFAKCNHVFKFGFSAAFALQLLLLVTLLLNSPCFLLVYLHLVLLSSFTLFVLFYFDCLLCLFVCFFLFDFYFMSSLFCFYLSLCLLTLFVGFFVAFLLCCMLYVCFWLACFVLFVLFVYSPCFLVYLQFVLLWLFLCMSFFWKRQLFLFPSVAFTIIFVCLFICSLSTLIVHFVDQKIWSSLPFVILGPDKLATGGNPRPIKSKHAAWIQIRKRALVQIRYDMNN